MIALGHVSGDDRRRVHAAGLDARSGGGGRGGHRGGCIGDDGSEASARGHVHGTGQTGSAPGKARAVGIVVVRKSWDGSTFADFTKARTDAHGRYRVVITPKRRGLLRLRIVPPDKHVVSFVLQVT